MFPPRVMVLGGLSSTNRGLDSVEFYDGLSDEWSPGPPMPEPRAGFGAAVIENCLYVVGGTNRHACLKSCFRLDLNSMEYRRCADMPTPRKLLSVVALGNKLLGKEEEKRRHVALRLCPFFFFFFLLLFFFFLIE